MFYNRVIFFAAYREGSRNALETFTGLFSVFIVIYKNLFDNIKLEGVVHLIVNTLVTTIKVHFKRAALMPDTPVAVRQLDSGKDILDYGAIVKRDRFLSYVDGKAKGT